MTSGERTGGQSDGSSTQAAVLSQAIQAALEWRGASGWPGREYDLRQAARWIVKLRGPTQPASAFARWHADLAHALAGELGQRYQDGTAGHRSLLCLMLTNALIRSPQLEPVY